MVQNKEMLSNLQNSTCRKQSKRVAQLQKCATSIKKEKMTERAKPFAQWVAPWRTSPSPRDLIKELPVFAWLSFRISMDQWTLVPSAFHLVKKEHLPDQQMYVG